MNTFAGYLQKLKDAICRWVGEISVEELYENVELTRRVEELLKSVSRLSA